MFTIEQLEKAKKHYEELIEEYKEKVQENLDHISFYEIQNDICLRIRKGSELRVHKGSYAKIMEQYNSYIEIDLNVIKRNEQELEELNRMIEVFGVEQLEK